MKIKTIIVGKLHTNCYIFFDPETREGAVIDPGSQGDKILDYIDQSKIKVKYIINTHGHYDHIGADLFLKEKLGAEILIHGKDAAMLKDPMLNLSFYDDVSEIGGIVPDRLLKEGDTISVGNISFKVLHTPGHTPGSICLLSQREIFTGDTLFECSVGRTDLPGGSFKQLKDSLKNKILNLPDHLIVYPGHGPSTTMEHEKKLNPYLKQVY
ncbi:MAG: MBL fold metallo-hydrolase [Clostridia bacterium]|nr:MBL fold metallo-hydrolase [Clostridia bacterium]